MIVIVHFTVDIVSELYQKLSLSEKREIYPQIKIYPSVEINKSKTLKKNHIHSPIHTSFKSSPYADQHGGLASERLVEYLDNLNSIPRAHGVKKKTPKSKLLTFTLA